MSGIIAGAVSAVVVALCTVLASTRGARWCRGYARMIDDPVPRHTWLVGTVAQAVLALLASGAVVGWALAHGAPLEGILAAPVAVVLCQAGSVDAVCHRLPDVLLASAAGFALISGGIRLWQQGPSLSALGVWAGAAALVLAITTVLALIGSGMGLGDVKLMGVAGLWLGPHGLAVPLWSLMGGFLLAGPVALALIVFRRLGRKDPMAFGPYLIAGILITWALGLT